MAIRVIQHLTQKILVSQYIAKFKEYADKTEQNNNALYIIYYKKLKENIKNEFMRIRANIILLPNLIKAAININNRLYKR